MEKTSIRKFLLGYLKSRRLFYWCYLVCGVMMLLVFGMYRYPWAGVGYLLLLQSVAILLFEVYGFYRYATVCKSLVYLAGSSPLGELPLVEDLQQQLYSDVIKQLDKQRKELEQRLGDVKKDAEDYYTLWVHQIKTPISAMRLLLQHDDGRPSLGTDLQAELYLVEQYVGMVMQYQRLSSSSFDLVLQQHNIETMVKKAVKNLAPLFIRKKISLQLGELDSVVVTDEKWFVFVLEQLLANALKYTNEGHVHVGLDQGVLFIEDTGIGILRQDLPRVFERGYTGTSGRMDHRSSGIGLYLCREIMTRLGFVIRIDSQPHKGTRVALCNNNQPLEKYE